MKRYYSIFLFIFLIIILMFFQDDTEKIYKNNVDSVCIIRCNDDCNKSYGTGVFISEDGYLLINYHIISYKNLGDKIFQDITVFISNEEYKSIIVKYDKDLDLALLKIDKNNCKKVKLSTKENTVGKSIYTIGNINNYGLTYCKGIISSNDLWIDNNSYLSLNIDISNGSSGGPVFNEKGKMIGLIKMRLKDESMNIVYGYAYAIKAKQIIEFMGELL